MSLLTDVRFALNKYIENSVVSNIISFEAYKRYCELTGEEVTSSRFEEIHSDENSILVFDSKSEKAYLRKGNKIYSSKNTKELKEFAQK